MLTVNEIAALDSLPEYDRANPVECQAFIAAFDHWVAVNNSVPVDWLVRMGFVSEPVETFDIFDAMDEFIDACDIVAAYGTADTYVPRVSDDTVALPFERIGTVAR